LSSTAKPWHYAPKIFFFPDKYCQVIVLLLPPPPETVIETSFNLETTRHEYRVMQMWEENPEIFLNDEALLPLAPLAATNQPAILLQQVVEKVNQVAVNKRGEISAYTQILAGLKYKKELIRQLFREEIMRDSVIYQEILEEGEQRGREEGERSLVLRLLTRRVGELPQQVRQRIETLPLEQLENLGEALLDFTSMADLQA
jgi:predicted transposase YdaD